MSSLKFVFVHGLSGWGSYDKAYRRLPYWGMRGGDLMGFLRVKGFDCYAASVSPTGSAWDRACDCMPSWPANGRITVKLTAAYTGMTGMAAIFPPAR